MKAASALVLVASLLTTAAVQNFRSAKPPEPTLIGLVNQRRSAHEWGGVQELRQLDNAAAARAAYMAAHAGAPGPETTQHLLARYGVAGDAYVLVPCPLAADFTP